MNLHLSFNDAMNVVSNIGYRLKSLDEDPVHPYMDGFVEYQEFCRDMTPFTKSNAFYSRNIAQKTQQAREAYKNQMENKDTYSGGFSTKPLPAEFKHDWYANAVGPSIVMDALNYGNKHVLEELSEHFRPMIMLMRWALRKNTRKGIDLCIAHGWPYPREFEHRMFWYRQDIKNRVDIIVNLNPDMHCLTGILRGYITYWGPM